MSAKTSLIQQRYEFCFSESRTSNDCSQRSRLDVHRSMLRNRHYMTMPGFLEVYVATRRPDHEKVCSFQSTNHFSRFHVWQRSIVCVTQWITLPLLVQQD